MRAKILSVSELNEDQIISMYQLMNEYYDHVTLENFRKDLFEKQKVILLVEKDLSIRGFSTIVQNFMNSNGRSFIALYSGDTVLEKKYWGNGLLARTFGKYLIEVKLKNPGTSVYWFLISKGYKTYLLMTNNFPVHFPRYEKSTPASYKSVMDHFYGNRFQELYDSQKNLIRFDPDKISYLKSAVADITGELKQNPRIAFFEQANPDWKDGVELACVAKVTLWIPVRYAIKRIFKFLKNFKVANYFEVPSDVERFHSMEKGLQQFIASNQDSHERWEELKKANLPSVFSVGFVPAMTPFYGRPEWENLSETTKANLYLSFMQFNAEALVLLELILCEGMKVVARQTKDQVLSDAAWKLIREEVDHSKAFLKFLRKECPQFPEKSHILRNNKLFKNSFLWIARTFPVSLALPGAKIESYIIFYGKALLKAFKENPNDWSRLNELHLLDEVHHIGYEFDMYKKEMDEANLFQKMRFIFGTFLVILYFQICFLIGCYRIIKFEMPGLKPLQRLSWTLKMGAWTLRCFEPYAQTRKYLRGQFENRKPPAWWIFKFMYR